MAHHNSTPESVLKAPSVAVGVIHEHTGISRRERRKVRTSTGRTLHVPKALQAPATNTPYVKPRPAVGGAE